MGMHHEIHPTWTLLLGKGPGTALLEPLLQGLAPRHEAVRFEPLHNPAPNLPAPTLRGRLVLDADNLDGHHLAQIQRFLAQASGWELVLLAREASPCLARELVGPAHVYWWPGPITVEQAILLFHPPRTRESATLPQDAQTQAAKQAHLDGPEARRRSPLQFADPDEELGAIQAILSAPLLEEIEEAQGTEDPMAWEPDLDSPIPPIPETNGAADLEQEATLHGSLPGYIEAEQEGPGETSPVFDPFAVDPGPTPSGGWATRTQPAIRPASEHPVDVLLRSLTSEPTIDLQQALADEPISPAEPRATLDWQTLPWYKGQIADLSDLAQRLHLDLFALEEDASFQGQSIAIALREDVARLSQFARTLSFLAAPPARGEQIFSIATLVQEQLGALTGLGPEAPRFLFRGQTEALVRSDKMLLVSALDALLQVAGQCAGKHPESVRVSCLTQGESAVVRISFAPGPLSEFTAEQVFEPYALRACLPDIGPNALSAARSILQGQGGDLSLHMTSMQPCSFELRLPLQG